MKPMVAGLLGVIVSASMSVGCGPGLSHRAKAPEPITDVFGAMDAELSHAMLSTTQVTSAPSESRIEVATTSREAPAVAAQTWGAGAEGAREREEAGELDTRD